MYNVLVFAGCLLVPLIVGGFSGVATRNAIRGWYTGIKKPAFNPPNIVFGPVWTVLYILMGITLYITIRQEPSAAREKALLFFAAQLVLNFAWSIIFFYYHRIGLALIELIFLWVVLVFMIVALFQVNSVAAYLQLPYFFWVTFAGVLNAGIWELNKAKGA